jgi:hypothetical protein
MMRVQWQYRHAAGPASQDVATPGQLRALLATLHERAAADRWPHAVLLSPGRQPGQGPEGPPEVPWLALVTGTGETPVWHDSREGGQQISIAPLLVVIPPRPGSFRYHHRGYLCLAPDFALVPRADAWQAAQQFVDSGGQRPPVISWLPPDGHGHADPPRGALPGRARLVFSDG